MPPSPPSRIQVDIENWIEAAAADPIERHRRQAVEILIKAISSTRSIRDTLFLKGGTLMNLAYASPRTTADIDFTAIANREHFEKNFTAHLDKEMDLAALDLGYSQFIFRVQSSEMRPPGGDFPWPTLRMSIGFAEKTSGQAKRLAKGLASRTLKVDISFGESVYDWQEVEIRSGDEDGTVILAYSVYELVAEKLRAIIQQKIRNRYRRQDIFDIARIVSDRRFTQDEAVKIFEIFLQKCATRDIAPARGMIDDAELVERSRQHYGDLRLDTGGGALDFEADFEAVATFYRTMPWP